jgi:NADPH:quinone reductase-like Zn-dependent oxidoreductase
MSFPIETDRPTTHHPAVNVAWDRSGGEVLVIDEQSRVVLVADFGTAGSSFECTLVAGRDSGPRRPNPADAGRRLRSRGRPSGAGGGVAERLRLTLDSTGAPRPLLSSRLRRVEERRVGMKAIVQDEYGSADVLRLEDVETPVAGRGEVLIRVIAASAFLGDWHVMTGTPYAIRLVSGLRTPKQRVRGQDVAGEIEAVGEGVTAFRPGDEVFGIGSGTFAEYATALPDKIAPKPANLGFEEAATVPTTGCTALQGIRDVGKVRSGQRVMVIGAAGGVGSFAVQIAKAFGAHVTGVCSTSKVELVRSIGADEVIDYTKHDVTEGTRRYDVIFDTAGNRPASKLRQGLTPKGTLVLAGGEGGGRWLGMGRVVRAKAMSPFVGQKMTNFLARPNGKDLVVLKELIEAGKLKPVIGSRYQLRQVPAAVAEIEAGHGLGKVVITV